MHYTVSGAAAVAVTSLFSAVEGHGFVNGAKVNGVWTAGSDPLWWYAQQNNQPLPVTSGWRALNQDIGFVEPANLGTTDIACHKSAKTNTGFINVAAGSTITLFWNTWPEGHKGPIINYLAPVSGTYSPYLFPSSTRCQRSVLNNPRNGNRLCIGYH